MDRAVSVSIMNILGLARRAGILLIGQDQVLKELRHAGTLMTVVTSDCSPSLLRRLKAKAERGEITLLTLEDTDRSLLGSHLGVDSAQIAALPYGGLAKKVLAIYDGSGANEQNQSI